MRRLRQTGLYGIENATPDARKAATCVAKRKQEPERAGVPQARDKTFVNLKVAGCLASCMRQCLDYCHTERAL